MHKQIMGLAMVLVIAMPGCTINAAPKSPKLARCDGHHRRTANPYGSILPTVDPQTGTSTPASQTPGNAGVDVFPGKIPTPPVPAKPPGQGDEAEPAVPPISSAQSQRIYQSC